MQRIQGWQGSTLWSRWVESTADAIITPEDGGDAIQEAFDDGDRTVVVLRGTYVLTSDLEIPPGACLIGECPGSVFLDLSAGVTVRIDGSGRQTEVGTISVPTGSTTVTGVATVFTDLNPGDFIQLDDAFYPIASITNNLSLELASAYRGNAIAGQDMVGQSMAFGSVISAINMFGSTTHALELIQCFRCFLNQLGISRSGSGADPAIQFTDCASVVFQGSATESNNGTGVKIDSSVTMFFLAFIARNNDAAGIVFEGSRSCLLSASVAFQNASNGISVLGTSTRISLLDCFCSANDQKGIETSASSLTATIANCTFERNGSDGIDFDGSANVVEGCLIQNNGGDGISAGDDGVIDGCHVMSNGGDGISLMADQDCAVTACVVSGNTDNGIRAGEGSTITGNRVLDNGDDGILVQSQADDCIISANRVSGNGGDGVVINAGTQRTTLMGNNLRGNTGASLTDNGANTLKDTADAGGDYNQT
jgi:parallel beta-helix repeat protein